MGRQRILLALTCSAAVAILGCNDGTSSGGGSGGGGAGATGGAGGGGESSCQAICDSSCVAEGVDPADDDCLFTCAQTFPDDNCGAEAQAFLDCFEEVDCIADDGECQGESVAWASCVGAVNNGP